MIDNKLVKEMTPERAAYFMRRFKREEKLLGPNEQAAIDYIIALLEQPSQTLDRDAARFRWLWNNAHNVSFTYQINPHTKSTVMGLHCGSLLEAIDAAINAKN